MKRFVLISVLSFITMLYAQNEDNNDFTFGVKGGISFNHFFGDIPIDIEPQLRTGFTVGIFGNYKLSANFSIQPEIIYSREGSNFKEFVFTLEDFSINDLSLDMHVESNWIDLPLLGIYHINDSFSIFGGPYVGFYIDGKAVIEPSVIIFDIDLEYDIDADDLNLPDFGIIIGVMYNLTDRLAIQGQWECGLQDLSDELINLSENEVIDLYNSSFQIQLDFTI